jgi:hypothetical protein
VARDGILEVVDGLLRLDHRTRWSADECLRHFVFNN